MMSIYQKVNVMSLEICKLFQQNEHVSLISNNIELDLIQGPYITGSYLTWLIEKNNNNPVWSPDDLDISCTSVEQHEKIKNILRPLASTIKETNWLGTGSTYWMIDGFKFQTFVHPVTAEQRVAWTDFSINSIATDGKDFISSVHTVNDINNKILRFDGLTNHKWPRERIDNTKVRYKKYLDRGYVDVDNMSLKKINQVNKKAI